MQIKTIIQEHLIELRNQNINHKKLFCVESMLDEFSSPDCCPFMEPYLDYRVIRLSRCMIIELAILDRGVSLSQMTKFEKAIVFKDIREHLLKILMSLAYLKARFVKNSDWLEDENVKFDLDTFEPKINNYVAIDVLGTQNFYLGEKNVDLADIGGESQIEHINGDFVLNIV